jgi:transposase
MTERVTLPDLDTLDFAALKTLILSQHEQLASRDSEIEQLKLLIAKLRRMQFGRKSEKLDWQIEQLELKLDELEASRAEKETSSPTAKTTEASVHVKPARRPLPPHLPREERKIWPKQEACPDCGGKLKPLGEDVSENPGARAGTFQSDPSGSAEAGLRGLRQDRASRSAEPSHRGRYGWAGTVGSRPGLQIWRPSAVVSTTRDLCSGRSGARERSTMASWVGGVSRLLEPSVEALRRYVMAAQKLHADDTPVPVLAPGNGKTQTGRLWTYVRDDRPAGDESPPAVWFAYTPDRKGEHPQAHLNKFTGTLQADAYAGYNPVYETGRVWEAGCMAHVRRKFYDLVVAHKSPVATEALERIATGEAGRCLTP